MNYQETVSYLFQLLPMYQRVGHAAYKKDLTNTIALCEALGNPQEQFKSIHVGGTNGKGSCSHMLEAVFRKAGYKTGLYTSPHLKSFTERIRVDGVDVSETFITSFVRNTQPLIEKIQPSFFELTVAMAFKYFADCQVDVAIVEVGLGGRLDSTNIIHPDLSIITNVSLDHTEMLGLTVPEIAMEKAGIVKESTPVVIGESGNESDPVFMDKAKELNAPIRFADRSLWRNDTKSFQSDASTYLIDTSGYPLYQQRNLTTVLASLEVLKSKYNRLDEVDIAQSLQRYLENPTVKGRWQVLSSNPLTICDTAHNAAGIQYVIDELLEFNKRLFFVWGMVKEKDAEKILRMLPVEATYFFCQAIVPRAMEAEVLMEKARVLGLAGTVVKDVNEACSCARKQAGEDDLVFIGGSTFVVAEINGL